MPPTGSAAASLAEQNVGLLFFFVSLGYCALIVALDSRANRKFVISKNLLRHLLDGTTFASGITIGLALFFPSIFTIVASNFVYVTVTSATCTLGPLINLAERYGWLIEN